jgi:hypothetical protein
MNLTSIGQTLLDLETKYWQAMKDKDVETATRLTADPCILAGPQGIGRIDHASLARVMTTAPYTLRSFELRGDVQIRMLSDDVAVLAYRVHEELVVEGERVTLDAADTSTWIRRGGEWVCAIHTEALAGDPYGRHVSRPSIG